VQRIDNLRLFVESRKFMSAAASTGQSEDAFADDVRWICDVPRLW